MQDFRRPGRSGLRPHRSLRLFSVQPFAFNSFSGAKFAFSNVAGRCLDAAHGVAAPTIRIVQRTVLGFGDAKAGPVVVAVGIGGRSPVPRPDAGIPQGSRRTVAVARSRRCGRSLEWMARRVRTDDFARNADASCGSWSRAGRSLPQRRSANIRLSPGVPRRLRPTFRTWSAATAHRSPGPAARVAAVGANRHRRKVACQFIGRKPRVRLGCTAGAPVGVPADR